MSKLPRRSIEDRRAAHLARHPKLATRLAGRDIALPRNDVIALGAEDNRRLITIDDRPRFEHMHAIGATGSGKSTFLLNCILQDIARGRGVCVLDPHGGHPDSLINMVLRFLHDYDWAASGKVHILSPNIKDYIVGFNPLAPLPGTDVSVISDAMLEAFQRAWGDEDTHEKPTTRSLLKAIFMALIELRMNLPDAKYLLDHKDRDGVRADALARLENEYARDELDRLHQLSLEARSAESFRANIIGPVNRLNEFVSSDAIRTMLGMNREQATPDNTIDLLDIMNKGHILLVDLQHGTRVSESDTDLLGKILLRYFFMLMPHRKPHQLGGDGPRFHPFFLYVDECHRYMTQDIQSMLAEARKFSIGVSLAHQYLAQLGKPGDGIYEAVRNSTQIKAVFRINSADEAQTLAHDIIPFDLETPVKASIRPVVVGHTIGRLRNDTYTVSEIEGTNTAEILSEATAYTETAMEQWAQVRSKSLTTGRNIGSGTTDASGTASGVSAAQSQSQNTAFSYDPNTGTFGPELSGMNVGTGDSSGVANIASQNFQRAISSSQSESSAQSLSEGESYGGAHGFSKSTSHGRAVAEGRSKQRGTARGEGSGEAMIPTYQDLPTSFHSKDNMQYMAGEMIRKLPTGRAAIRFRGNTTLINIPPPRRRRTK